MRIRTVKPEFWTHPVMSRIEADARLLALALLNYSDDHGYFLADPALVRGACCPFVEDSSKVRRWLAKLSEIGWIALSADTAMGVIGKVVNFEVHQKVDRPKDSALSSYWIDDESTIDRRLIDDASSLEGKGKEQGKEGKGTGKELRARFEPPTVEEVTEHCREKGYTFSPADFVSYYEVRGWVPNGSKLQMRSWQAACRTWQGWQDKRQKEAATPSNLDQSRIARGRTAADYAAVTIRGDGK